MVAKKTKKVEEDENVGDLIKGMYDEKKDEETEVDEDMPKIVTEDDCFFKLTESSTILRNLITGNNDFTNMESDALSDAIICVETMKNNYLEMYFKIINAEIHNHEGEMIESEQ
jgi:hypothetical protein